MKFLPRVRRPIAPARGGNRPFLAAEAHAAPVAAAPWLLLQAAAGCPARGSVLDQPSAEQRLSSERGAGTLILEMGLLHYFLIWGAADPRQW